MSFWRAPALMRVIQRRRKSRFLFLRSRYAYLQPRSTVSLAAFHSLLRPPYAPRAAFMICFFRFRRGTFDLARGMVSSPLRLQQALDSLRLTANCDDGATPQTALPFRRFLREDVALERVSALHLARARELEALPRALVRFHLPHSSISVARALTSARRSSS